MSSDTKRILLKVVSVIFIIFGIFSVLQAIIGLFAGSVVAIGVNVWAGLLAIIVVLLACAGGILEFVAGVHGLKGNYDKGRSIGIILLVLAVLGFIADGFKFSWDNSVASLLPVLSLGGIK